MQIQVTRQLLLCLIIVRQSPNGYGSLFMTRYNSNLFPRATMTDNIKTGSLLNRFKGIKLEGPNLMSHEQAFTVKIKGMAPSEYRSHPLAV